MSFGIRSVGSPVVRFAGNETQRPAQTLPKSEFKEDPPKATEPAADTTPKMTQADREKEWALAQLEARNSLFKRVRGSGVH